MVSTENVSWPLDESAHRLCSISVQLLSKVQDLETALRAVCGIFQQLSFVSIFGTYPPVCQNFKQVRSNFDDANIVNQGLGQQ